MQNDVLSIIYLNNASPALRTLINDNCVGMLPCYGKYHVLDFPLSNFSHAHLYNIGIIANHPSWKLMHYINNSSNWHIDPSKSNITFLPYHDAHTKNNLMQHLIHNIDYIDYHNPKYIFLVSGDQIYTMDYTQILAFHHKNNADVTLGVIDVPWEKASRYTTVHTNTYQKVQCLDTSLRFAENNTISMGIYVFKWHVLKKYLLQHMCSIPYNNTHFGDVITYNMLNNGHDVMSYPFTGYWQDIKTIQDFWNVHMNCLTDRYFMKIYQMNKHVHTKKSLFSSTYIDSNTRIENTLIGDGCRILGDVKNAVIFPNVHIEKNAFIENAIVMSNSNIRKYQYVSKCIVLNPSNNKKTGYTMRIFPVQNNPTNDIAK